MNDKELIGKVHNAMYQQCQRRGYAAPVDVLMDIGVLPKRNMRTGGMGAFPIWRASAQSTSASSLSTCTRCASMHRKQG